MAAEQPASTKLIDLAVEWISPVLVMLMVGSLTFFLTEVAYRGEYPGRMLYTLFFFVFGAVLIARLSIQESRRYASIYAAMLGFACLLALLRFREADIGPGELLLHAVVMGLIWWAADVLTWDCTHLEEGRKASGRGLLAAAGLDESVPAEEAADEPAAKPKRAPDGWLERWQAYREERRKRPHTPGIWVLYFALAALPVFALGQSLIDPSDAARRRATFLDMAVYIGSALGLLVTTSLMGLRRYLEERGAKVPTALTLGWMGLGGGLIAAFLLVGGLLPRPHSETPWFGMSKASNTSTAGRSEGKGGDGRKEASKNAMVRDKSAGKGEGAAGEKTERGEGKSSAKGGEQKGGDAGEKGSGGGKGQSKGGGQKQQGKSGKPDDQSGEKSDRKDDQSGRDTDRKESRAKDDRKSGDEKGQKGEETRDAENAPPKEDGSSASGKLGQALDAVGSLARWAVWVVIALAVIAAVVYFLVKGLAPFTDWAKRLLDWWRSLFARKPTAGSGATGDADEAPVVDRPPPFLDFRDPFADGSAKRKPAAELVTYTFAAMDSWAWDRNLGRRPGETPAEFAVRLGHEFESLDEPGYRLAELYGRVLYARGQLPADAKQTLAAVWQALGSGRPARGGVR